MTILGIDTSENVLSISIYKDEKFLSSISINEKKKTASMLILYIDYLLKQLELDIKNIDVIAICSGPGSYTSLRIGYATSKTLSIVNNIKFIEVSKFRIMAETFLEYQNKFLSNINITSILPTTYHKLLYQTFLYDISSGELKETSTPKILDISSLLEKAKQDNSILVGKFRDYKKANEFEDILNLKNYYEYKDKGSSASIVAEISLKLASYENVSEPFKAEPLYMQAPWEE